MDTSLTRSDPNSCTQMLTCFLDQKQDNGAAMMSLVEGYINHFSSRYYDLSFHEQQDILQEVAIKLVCSGEKLRSYCPKSWVYTVVRNQCINHIRNRSRHLSAHDNFIQGQIDGNDAGTLPLFYDSTDDSLIDELDCLEKVFNRVEAQPTGKADIFLYTLYAFGFSYAEISKRAQRTVSAVGTRISLLKKRIKAFIEECC